MKTHGPDSVNSWITSLACCFINMVIFGTLRLRAVLFVESVSRFKITRQKASFPYVFASFTANTAGPLVGCLGHRFGVRPVATFGALLGALGIGLCYFADVIDVVTVLWGLIFGLGFGMTTLILPVSINEHFAKHRASASGISFSGAGLGSLILPPIADILLENYGLSGMFLILGGFVLNCVPAALLLRKPQFQYQTRYPSRFAKADPRTITSGIEGKCNRESISTEEQNKSIVTITSETLGVGQIKEKYKQQTNLSISETKTRSLSSCSCEHSGSSVRNETLQKDSFRFPSVMYKMPTAFLRKARSKSTENISAEAGIFSARKNSTAISNNFETKPASHHLNIPYKSAKVSVKIETISNVYLELQQRDKHSKKSPAMISSISDRDRVFADDRKSSQTIDLLQDNVSSTKEYMSKRKKISIWAIFSVVIDPIFILVSITFTIYIFSFNTVIMIIVDFSIDLQVGATNEKYILMAFSFGDLVGRLSIGWITDRGYMSLPVFSATCFLCAGLATVALAWSNGFITIITIVTFYSLSKAGLMVIYPIIIAAYIEQDKQTIAMATKNVLIGPVLLTISPLIGYFRDSLGSYVWMFYGSGILSIACGVAWILAPCIAKSQKKTKC